MMTELGQRVGSGQISMSSALDPSKMSLSIYSYRDPDSA